VPHIVTNYYLNSVSHVNALLHLHYIMLYAVYFSFKFDVQTAD